MISIIVHPNLDADLDIQVFLNLEEEADDKIIFR